ncbi:MAG: transposase [Ardenticatenaceae bacterium]
MLRPTASDKKGAFDPLLAEIFRQARKWGLIDRKPEAAIDSTGLETRHASRHYVARAGQKRYSRHDWPKLTVVCHTQSHLLAGAVASRGPSQDSPEFFPAVCQAGLQFGWHRLLGDAGYDAEHNHQLCRDVLGMKSSLIALNKRGTGRKWPKTKYRRQMKRTANRQGYGQRWQVESAISRNKRLLGSALRSRSNQAQASECLFRVLTHNLMILR